MVSHHQVRDVLELALEQHGPNARALAGAVAELVPYEHRATAYADVVEVLRPLMWPRPRCACELAVLVQRALPTKVR